MHAESVTIHILPNVSKDRPGLLDEWIGGIENDAEDCDLTIRRSGTVRHPILEVSKYNVAGAHDVIDMIAKAAVAYGVKPEDILRTMAHEIEEQRKRKGE